MEISGQIHKNSLNYSLFSSVNSSIGLSGVAGDASTMFFGTISGGITAELTGGNFWQGAATGLAVSALNHVAHRVSEPKRQSISQSEATLKCERCWWLDNDEYLTFEEAIWHYRLGNGEPVNVKLSKMDLSILKVSDFDNPDFIHQGNPGRYVRLSSINSLVSGNRSEGLVYGTIEVVYIGGNKVMALPNEYDFNMNWEQSIRGFSRDIATFYGGLYNSMGMGGQSYWIQFIGTATIK